MRPQLCGFLIISAAMVNAEQVHDSNAVELTASSQHELSTSKRDAEGDKEPFGIFWETKTQELPIDLGTDAERARVLFTTSSSRVRLSSALIRRISETNRSDDRFPNFWIVDLGFEIQSDPSKSHSSKKYVSLGHFVQVTNLYASNLSHSQNALTNLIDHRIKPVMDNSIQNSTRGYYRFGEAPRQVNPFVEAKQPSFRIPSVQWRPPEKFPLNLRMEAGRLENLLCKQKSIRADSLMLTEISLDRFLPIGAIKLSQGNVVNHLDHWIVTYRYEAAKAASPPGYNVYTLLDGTALAFNDWDERLGSAR